MFIREVQNFERGLDPIKSMGIGSIEAVRQYLISQGVNPDYKDEIDENRVLEKLLNDEKYDYIKILKARGLNLNCDDSTLLRKLAWKEKFEEAKILIKLGANLNKAIKEAKDRDETVTYRNLITIHDSMLKESLNFERGQDTLKAMGIGRRGLVQRFLNETPDRNGVYYDLDDIDITSNYEQFKISDHIIRNRRFDLLQILVDDGWDLNFAGGMLLRNWAFREKYDIAKKLMDMGASLSLAIRNTNEEDEPMTYENLHKLKNGDY